MRKLIGMLALVSLFTTNALIAQTTFEAILSGFSEAPSNASPGIGFGTVVLNAAQNQITVDESWVGLLAPATASHIHGPAPLGVIAGVMFPLSGVPAATSGSIPQQTFAITPTQVGYLFSGNLYLNIHSQLYPGGEIRGQLQLVPEPTTFTLLGLGSLALVMVRRRR